MPNKKELKQRYDGSVSNLRYIEKTSSTTEKPDRRLTFLRFIPAKIMEKAMRSSLAKLRGGSPQKVNLYGNEIKTSECFIAGYNGKIKLRIYNASSSQKSAATMFFHGGGFFGGTLDNADNYCSAYAAKMNKTVISVEYHLAPEYPFPHGLEDCYLACKWVNDNADTLKIDKNNITVSGDSAGGNFAAVIALIAKEKKEFSISRLILLYPYVTFKKPKLPMTKVMHKWYLNGAERTDIRVSPLEGDLKDLPPVLTVVCEYDLLAKSGIEFAEKLAQSDVDSTLVMFKKTRHAFLDRPEKLKQTADLLEIIKDWKDEKLSRTTEEKV